MTGDGGTFTPGALALNPAGAARLEMSEGRTVGLHWRGLAPRRSWRPLRLTAQGERAPLFHAARRMLEAGVAEPLSPAITLPLWQAGLLLTPAELSMLPPGLSLQLERAETPVAPWLTLETAGRHLWRHLSTDIDLLAQAPTPQPTDADRACFAAGRWTWLKALLTPHETAMAAAIWRRLANASLLTPIGNRGDRINNDPLGRALLHRLTPVIEQVVGRSLRQSYSFAMDYGPGAELMPHIDRAQCEYTVSLFIDYLPPPADGRSPWPLEVELSPGDGFTPFFQAPGDGVLFRGRELRHGRPPLAEQARCLVLMLHWVDADFPDADMDRS